MGRLSAATLVLLGGAVVVLLTVALALGAYIYFDKQAEMQAREAAYARSNSLTRLDLQELRTSAGSDNRSSGAANTASIVTIVDPEDRAPSIAPPPPGSAGSVSPVEVDGAKVVGVWTPIADQSWLFVGERLAPYKSRVAQVVGLILFAGLISALPLVAIGVLLRRRLQSELGYISVVCTRVGDGDFEGRLPHRGTLRETRDIAQSVNGMIERLEIAVREARTLSRLLAHDSRSYLNKLRLLIQKDEAGENRAAALMTLGLLDKLTVEVSRWSQAQHARLAGAPTLCDLSTIVEKACELFSESLEDAGIAVEKRTKTAYVATPEPVVLEIINNLLSNALVHAAGGKRIILETLMIGDTAVLKVEDAGPGISPEIADRVFELNFRADRENPGSGAGLALTQFLSKLAGGKVELVSPSAELGGAEFSVHLPSR